MLPIEVIIKTFEEEKVLTRDKVDELVKLSNDAGEPIDKFLTSRGYLTEKKALEIFAKCLGIEFKEKLLDCTVPEVFVSNVPVQFARNHNVIGIGEQNGFLIVATSSCIDTQPIDEVSRMLKKPVKLVFASRVEIATLINKSYQKKIDVVDEMLKDMDVDDIGIIAREVEKATDLLDLAHKAPIIKLVNMFLFQALKMRSSDVHIQPYEDKLQIRYRIDGILYDIMTPPKKLQEAIISRVKVMGRMDIAEKRLPQDGRATIKLGDSEVDVRIASIPTSHGERIVMRLLDKGARLLEIEELGLDEENLKILSKVINFPHGIIFVTGPTGSGKTTSLYAILKRLNTKEENVITIEDPIEYNIPGISQIEVSAKKGLTFATGLRSIVRQDPDTILVGEVRDLETATIAIQSALTGHLVFSTIHTNDSASTITRLLDLGVESYLVASSVISAIAQRLIRLVCPACKESYVPESEELEELGVTMKDIPEGKLYKGRGCDQCLGSGYRDRTAIFEILVMNDIVREQTMRRVGANTIKQEAVKRGLITLRMDGARKVTKGLSTTEEVLRVTQMDVV